MKFLKSIMLIAVAVISFASCKKDCATPTYPVEGYWTGKYGSGTATPTSGFSMVVESGGKIVIADGATLNGSGKAEGTWTLTGNVFKATYTYSGGGNTFTIQANFNNSGKMEGGTYGPGAVATGGGTWFMDRRN
jgi:hypothetical protein